MPFELDQAALDVIRGLQRPGQPDVLAMIVNLFCESAPRLIATMGNAVIQGDYPAAATAAHTLKSSAAHLGLHELYELCTTIENYGGGATTEAIKRFIDRIQALYPDAEQALRAVVARGSQR